MWRADQHRRKRRRTTAEHIEILRRTQRSLIGRIDLNDQVDDRHDSALTEAEARIADLEEQVAQLAKQLREAMDAQLLDRRNLTLQRLGLLPCATTTSDGGAGTGALTAPAAAPLE